MLALAESWPEAVVAVAATVLQGWIAYLGWKQARANGEALRDSTVLTRSTDTTHEDRLHGAERREGE